jgi:uncharacterized lipoprotein YajG
MIAREGALVETRESLYMKVLASLVTILLILAGCSKDPETLVRGGYDEAEMDAAVARWFGRIWSGG